MNPSSTNHLQQKPTYEVEINNSELDFSIDQIETERRKQVRAPRKEPQGKLYYQLAFDAFAKRIFETTLGRIIFGFLMVASLSALIWEFGFRVQLLDNNLLSKNENQQLTDKLSDLNSKWSKEELKQIESNIKQAEAKIFESIPKLAEWLKGKSEASSQRGYQLKYNIGRSSSVDVNGTYSMPINFRLNAAAKNNNAYQNALLFMRSIIDENRRLEIVSTKFLADEKGISHFEMIINLWVKDPNGIISINDNSIEVKTDEFIQ